jgi:protein-S-isoprenylcysteine O-methyltransferase Ste14
MTLPPLQSDDAQNNATRRRNRSKLSLGARVALGFSLGSIGGAALLFVPAGTLKFWQGWVYLAILLVPSFSCYAYLLRHDRQLLERRMESKEPVSEQKLLMRWVKFLFVAAFALTGLDYRFGWSRGWLGGVPLWLTVLSQALALGGVLSAASVIAVNRFAARTVRVEPGQTVISTGPYRFVRHPLYAGSLVLWFFTPFALGSYISLPVFVLLMILYVMRLLNEEKVLRDELPGYTEYCSRTRYRLIPFVW